MDSDSETIHEDLSAYLDGELPESELRRLEEQLKADPALRAELEAVGSVQKLLRELPRRKAPVDLAERVLAQAERSSLLGMPEQAPGKRRFRFGWLVAAAAAAVLVFASMLVLPSLRRPDHHAGPPGGLAPAGRTGEGISLAGDKDGAPESAEVALVADAQEPRVTSPSAPKQPPKLDGPAESRIVPLNFVINTDNLVQAQREVEAVFARNELRVVEEKDRASRSGRAGAPVSNFYSQTKRTSRNVRYDVVLVAGRLRQIVDELNSIRVKQNVAQIPLVETERGLRVTELAAAEPSVSGRVVVDGGLPKPTQRRGGTETAGVESYYDSAGGRAPAFSLRVKEKGVADLAGKADEPSPKSQAALVGLDEQTVPASKRAEAQEPRRKRRYDKDGTESQEPRGQIVTFFSDSLNAIRRGLVRLQRQYPAWAFNPPAAPARAPSARASAATTQPAGGLKAKVEFVRERFGPSFQEDRLFQQVAGNQRQLVVILNSVGTKSSGARR